MIDDQSILRQNLIELLKGGQAHGPAKPLLDEFSPEVRGAKPAGQSHTPWRLLEHIRLAQRDILDFIRSPDHESPPWPEGYWPEGDGPPDDQAWDQALIQFDADTAGLVKLVEDSSANLLAPIPHAPDYTLLREVLVVADHNAYHLGQLATLRALVEG